MKTVKEKKKTSFKQIFIILSIVGGALIVLLIASSIAYVISSKLNSSLKYFFNVSTTTLAILTISLLVIYCLFFGNLSYNDIFKNTKKTLMGINHLDRKINRYNNEQIEEFKQLNDIIDEIEKNKKVITVNQIGNYTNIDLEYIDEENHVITYDSLKDNIKRIITISASFHNALLKITYPPFKYATLVNNEDIINIIQEIFNYDGILIGLDVATNNFLVYLPSIDSISKLKEQVNLFFKQGVVKEMDSVNLKLYSPTISISIYPYSTMDNIISDIDYISRQNNPINFYLPNHEDKLIVANEVSDISFYSSIVEEFQIGSFDDIQENTIFENDKINLLIRKVLTYLGFENSGICEINQYSYQMINQNNVRLNKDKHLFNEGERIDKNFISSLVEAMDDDCSYYFSESDKINLSLKPYLDQAGVRSGFFQIFRRHNKIFGFIYFISFSNSAPLNSYQRQALTNISLLLSNYIITKTQYLDLINSRKRIELILSLTNYHLYLINKETFDLIFISNALKDYKRDIKLNGKCYKEIYGLDEPCKDCPLITGNRKISTFGEHTFLTRMDLTVKDDISARLLLETVDQKDQTFERYNKEYFINSYYSFVDRLNNLFISKSKGNVIIYKIYGAKEFISENGEEKYNMLVQRFLDSLKFDNYIKDNLYFYKNEIFAFILNERSRTDTLDIIEKISSLSRNINYYDNSYADIKNKIAVFKYPDDLTTSSDFIRRIENYLYQDINNLNIGEVIFLDTNYIRKSYRDDFILDVLDTAISSHSLEVKLFPSFDSKNLSILSAELLLRIKDEYSNVILNTLELINVAKKHNRIYLITDFLINYIADLYKNYGLALFKTAGFRHLSINTDTSYFFDTNFVYKTEALLLETRIPKNFLVFEINEKEIYENYDMIKQYSKKFTSIGILMSCDQYSGKYFTIEQLKDLGFSEVKLQRSMMNEIINNKDSLLTINNLIKTAKENNISLCIVGVEQRIEVDMLLEENKNNRFSMQGYYFKEPCDINALIKLIKEEVNR
ncbi:MAG: EAL domain-containing protein [Bacilli bacterium]